MKFIDRKGGFHASSVDQNTQKNQLGSGSFKLVGSQGYAHLRGHLGNGVKIMGTDQRVGRADGKIVIQVVHEVLDVIVGRQKPLKGVSQTVEEIGRRSHTKGEAEIDVVLALPVNAEEFTVLQADWAKPESVFNV